MFQNLGQEKPKPGSQPADSSRLIENVIKSRTILTIPWRPENGTNSK